MRADQWIMLGVAGLGLTAVYLLTRTQQQPAPQPTQPAQPAQPSSPGMTGAPPLIPVTPPPVPVGPAPPNPGLPAQPAPIMAPANVVFAGGGPGQPANAMSLRNSFAYQGRGENVSEADLGFLDAVQVFNTPDQARAGGIPDWAIAGAGQNTRWFYGRYTFPSMTYQMPARVGAIWQRAGQQALPRVSGTMGAVPYAYPMYAGARYGRVW
jgi:hypothetical protein